MAAAEARAAWQRTANRYFVQEDAKRAPKLACQSSSCATSKLVDSEPASAADHESDHAAINLTPLNKKSSFSNLTPESSRWLHLQPNYGFQKGVTYEQLNALEDDGVGNKTYKGGDGTDFGHENHDSSDYIHYDFLDDTVKKTSKGRRMQEEHTDSQAFPEIMDMMAKHGYCWIEGHHKAQAWWRTTMDRDELASFVSQKSLNHIENCDLPPPQKYLQGQPCAKLSDDKMITASLNLESKSSGFSSINVMAKGSLDSLLMHRKQGPSANKGQSYFASDKSLSCSDTTTNHDEVTEHVFEGNPSKAQLMEALCHSQTRAREAEEEAKQAYAEKEHIITLLFKQASQLFTYKQWCQMLLLENLYTQKIKNKDHQPISTLFPVALPRKKRKHRFSNATQKMLGKPKSDFTTCAVAFALGLSLVGAGLLLGWTVGWMLPRL